jgi:hypothetical protein
MPYSPCAHQHPAAPCTRRPQHPGLNWWRSRRPRVQARPRYLRELEWSGCQYACRCSPRRGRRTVPHHGLRHETQTWRTKTRDIELPLVLQSEPPGPHQSVLRAFLQYMAPAPRPRKPHATHGCGRTAGRLGHQPRATNRSRSLPVVCCGIITAMRRERTSRKPTHHDFTTQSRMLSARSGAQQLLSRSRATQSGRQHVRKSASR